MQIYANELTWPTFKNIDSTEPKYVHKFRKTMLKQIKTNVCKFMQMSYVTYFLKI